MSTLNLLILSDGKPGHYTQSLGLLENLQKTLPIRHQVLEIKPRIKLANHLLRALLNKKIKIPGFLLSLLYRFNSSQARSLIPGVIISTGGNTCGLNAALAQQYGCKNLYLGSLRKHAPVLFSAVITTTPMPDVDNSIVLDVAPSLINRETLQQAAHTFLQHTQVDTQYPLWAMLIGGEGSGYTFTQGDYHQLADGMLTLAKKYRIRWLLTTSRRTDPTHEAYLSTLLQHQKEVAHAVYFNSKPEKIMQGYLGVAERIFCTEDSTSMVSEAVITGKPVTTLSSQKKQINKGHAAVIDRFAQKQHIQRSKISQLGIFQPQEASFKPVDTQKGYEEIISVLTQS